MPIITNGVLNDTQFFSRNLLLPVLYHAGWETHRTSYQFPQKMMKGSFLQVNYSTELGCYVRSIPFHWLIMVTHGDVQITSSDGCCTVKENEVAHFQPHQSHHIRINRPTNYIWLHYKMLLPAATGRLLPMTPVEEESSFTAENVFHETKVGLPRLIAPNNPNTIKKLFTSTVEEFRMEKPGYTLAAKAHFNLLLSALFRESGISGIHSAAVTSDPAITKALDYMHQHYNQKMSIPELAALVNLSPNYFISRFGDLVGFSPNDYLNRVRIGQAKRLLRDTDMTLAEIAAYTGFDSLSYFSKMFRKKEGMPQREYKFYKSNDSLLPPP